MRQMIQLLKMRHLKKYSLMITMIQYTGKVLSAGLLLIGILCGCAQTEIENRFSESGDDGVGKPVAFSIGVVDTPEYNVETDGTPATHSGKPLLDEWVKVNSSNATRSTEAYEGPNIATMELVEDTASCTPQTRGMMNNGYYFRLIAFKKSGTDYEYHAAADYIINGMNEPVLQQGSINLVPDNYRFLAYSFNNANGMGDLPKEYIWNTTSIPISDLNSDFLTFDSGDQTVIAESFFLPVKFTHQLCKLTMKISVTGFDSNTLTNCTGVYIKGSNNLASWTVGESSAIVADIDKTTSFNIEDNSSTTTRLVPFAEERPITVHFGTLTVGGRVADNTEITSSQSVQLIAGRSYTMTVQFKKEIIYELTEPTAEGYVQIGKYKWAYANLDVTNTSQEDKPWISGPLTGNDIPTNFKEVTSATNDWWRWNVADVDISNQYPTDYPEIWSSETDPCEQYLGVHWKVPQKEYLDELARHILENRKVKINGEEMRTNGYGWVKGSKTVGTVFVDKGLGTCLFLPAAGFRNGGYYYSAGETGRYWSATLDNTNNNFANYLNFSSEKVIVDSDTRSSAYSLCCVKE